MSVAASVGWFTCVQKWFAGTTVWDDEPCQACAHAVCVCQEGES